MNSLFKLAIVMLLTTPFVTMATEQQSQLLVSMPDNFNSPASADIDSLGNVYFSSPNFHNSSLIKAGHISAPKMATIGKLGTDNQLSHWYRFSEADLHPVTKQIAPMGINFGPDGNLYVADMQMWFEGGMYQSRILRINLQDGAAVNTEVVATGFLFPNAVVWKGNDLFISDTVLKTEQGQHLSGVYKVSLDELDAKNPLEITPYKDNRNHDPHLFETFVSSAKLGFGANGLAFDGEGNLYTAIMEEGTVVKTLIDENGNKIKTVPFASGMKATDGMYYDAGTNKIYIADLFNNAVYAINMQGELELLAQNSDSDGANGELDGPSEVIVRGDQVIVMNFDAVFDSPEMVNKSAGRPHTLSVIKLK
ncbi:hypothetical protein ACFSJ3_17140 [Corallincola platygyrae]|uniref:SMP-30/Gluconolactonase/LRE-like region domain-containing protein n=1 Tax=Corallincola platygyrae TaxID=1193278 RepID=A0ABW4XTB4_9GAMM